MTAVTEGQIRAQVSAIRKKIKNDTQAFALRIYGGWTGPDRLQIDGKEHLVLTCASDLQTREALLQAKQAAMPAVLLCSIGSDQLGEDVIARFARHDVLPPDTREMVTELFSARIIDPRILSTKPLVDALLDRVPVGGYRPVAGGTLDLQQAWSALIEQTVGAVIEEPSLTQVLDWSLDPKKIKAIVGFTPELRLAFVDWLARTRGEAIRFVMAGIEAGFGAELIPLGFALGLVFSPELSKKPEFHAARARLENYFGGKDIDPESAHTWSRAAEATIMPLFEEPNVPALRSLLKRVDGVLADLKFSPFAYLSNFSPAGLGIRFDRLGAALQAAVKSSSATDLNKVRECLDLIAQHSLAPTEGDRIARAKMALRLIGSLRTATLPARTASLPELAEHYHRDGGFFDWARNRLRETDVSGPLQKAFEKILDQVNERLEGFEQRFAASLAAWTLSEQHSERLICIEDVLAKVIIPIAKVQPVLLLVLDGLSVAVFRQLLRDIERQDWAEITNDELGLPRPVLATIPSVTQISRRALFRGRLSPAKSGTEQGEFRDNDFLFQATLSQTRPKLFLKGDLQDEGHGGVAEGVRSAIADKKCRVVGVVVNAIDDHLNSGDQVVFTWSIESIKPLRELLKLAAESERVLVITSDHGHVLDFGTKKLDTEGGEAGDRYCLSKQSRQDSEIVIEGNRVEKATGQKQVVAAWSADVRYAAKKRGYHGGVNPQEMVVPLVILSGPNGTRAAGWKEVPLYEPEWWRITESEAALSQVAATERETSEPLIATVKGLELFEHVAATKAINATWIEALFDSVVYHEQLKFATRGGPPREIISLLLRTIDTRGGSIMKSPLAQALGVPLFRVDGLVQNICRILNVDGYEVLSFERSTETITLKTDLLKTQFEIQ